MNFKEVCKTYGYPIFSKETAECINHARTYLNDLMEIEKEKMLDELEYPRQGFDRQTDRQTDRQPRYASFYRKLTGTGEFTSRKHRKLIEAAKQQGLTECTDKTGKVIWYFDKTKHQEVGGYP